MSEPAHTHVRNQQRYREYKRNRSDSEPWREGVTPRADYDEPVNDLSDDQLTQQFQSLTKLQQQEVDNGDPQGLAKDIATRRNELWNEAERRGFESDLL